MTGMATLAKACILWFQGDVSFGPAFLQAYLLCLRMATSNPFGQRCCGVPLHAGRFLLLTPFVLSGCLCGWRALTQPAHVLFA